MNPSSAVVGSISVGAVMGVVIAAFNLPTPVQVVAPERAPVHGPAEIVQWDIPIVRNAYVQRFVDLFQEKQPDRMALYLKRSGRYEGMIREKLRAEGMPEDLVFLSMIESGFNPSARSKASAVGLWQFMAGTARDYGLRVDKYVDERRDPEKSTDAAIRHLKDLYEQFGSWSLAAAAYNSGANRVARIMREETGTVKGKESDFWLIRNRLPTETREYVPLMFAAALIGKEPQKYGLDQVERLLPIPVERVEVPGNTSLATLAEAIGLETEDLQELNPHLLTGRTPPGKAYPVRVPVGRSNALVASFGTMAEARATTEEPTHQVARGENLWEIARQHGVPVAALQRANDLGPRSVIRPGQRLRIPV